MKTIDYTIEFFSDWHCGSGLAAGADIDALVVKDRNGLPYVPGKTMKGLIREAVVDVLFLEGKNESVNAFVKAFGYFQDSENHEKGSCFFSNATIPDQISKVIIANDAQAYLYRKQSSTALDDGGIAKANTLRKIQTVIPLQLSGQILDVNDEMCEYVESGIKMIKRIGLNRNRGLGRCLIKIEKKGGSQ